MVVERVWRDGVEVVSVDGEIDIATSPRLLGVLNQVVTEPRGPVVVDLTGVGFMDSTGLALLINAHRRLTRRGQGFAVVCPPGTLWRVFEVTDMVDMLCVCPDVESATQAAVPA
jgi:anti-sigma B factor antagonist